MASTQQWPGNISAIDRWPMTDDRWPADTGQLLAKVTIRFQINMKKIWWILWVNHWLLAEPTTPLYLPSSWQNMVVSMSKSWKEHHRRVVLTPLSMQVSIYFTAFWSFWCRVCQRIRLGLWFFNSLFNFVFWNKFIVFILSLLPIIFYVFNLFWCVNFKIKF